MNMQRTLVFAYCQLLRLYPAKFRERFGEEMLEIANAAEFSEWPLIFGDTGIAIVRTWMQPCELDPVAIGAVPGHYLSLGECSVKPVKLLQGLGIATIVVLLACCVSMCTVWNLPTDRDYEACGTASAETVHH